MKKDLEENNVSGLKYLYLVMKNTPHPVSGSPHTRPLYWMKLLVSGEAKKVEGVKQDVLR